MKTAGMFGECRPKDLLLLRKAGKRRVFMQRELVGNLCEAYDFSAAQIGLMGVPVAAWKLGATTATTRSLFSANSIYFGPLIVEEIWSKDCGRPIPTPPQLRGEAEIAFRLARDVDLGEAVPEDTTTLFDVWAPVIEAPYSCIANIPAAGLNALIMDRCSAGALYIGECSTDLEAAEISSLMEICVGGVVVASGAAGSALLMSPMEAAVEFIRVVLSQGVSLKKGQWISTGGITSCVDLPFSTSITLNLGGSAVLKIEVPAPEGVHHS